MYATHCTLWHFMGVCLNGLAVRHVATGITLAVHVQYVHLGKLLEIYYVIKSIGWCSYVYNYIATQSCFISHEVYPG